jgi:hypothetical protein
MDVLFGSMPRIGQGGPRLIAAPGWVWPGLGALAALAPALVAWGFTVDDALISVRYARHIALGIGWRFNAHGPSTDGVTPLPWPILLAPFAAAAPLVVLVRAKVLGLVAAVVSAALLGRAVGRVHGAPAWMRMAALAVHALSVPVAAYAVSGMETPVCGALATVAALSVASPLLAAGLAGAAAALRPEMAPWALVLASGAALAARRSAARVALAGLVGLLPFGACAAVRLLVWGRVAPLAVLAKPSDLEHGLAYAAAASVVALGPVLVAAPMALRRTPAAMAIVVAGIAHIGAVALAGGDWMPFGRLLAPIVPSLCLAAVLASEHARPVSNRARVALAVGLGVWLITRSWSVILDGRRVTADRAALVASARPVLGPMRRVAALDVGWVGAATDADVIDLAGLTDPEIAVLPGGHTSKRLSPMVLLARDPDALILYAQRGLPPGGLTAWEDADYGRVVEARLAHDPVVVRHFEPLTWLPLGPRGAGYLVLRRLR